MSTEHEPFEFHHDKGLIIEWTVTKKDGAPEDISAWTGDKLQWGLSKFRGGPRVLTLNLDDGIAIVDGPAGRADVTLTEAHQDDLAPGWYWDEGIADGSEVASVQFHGRVLVKKSQFAVT